MNQQLLIILGIGLLALGTYGIRFAGFHLGAKFTFSEKYQVLLSNGATVLLCAIAVTTTFFEGQDFAGFARIFGVGLALLLVWKKVPLLLVICLAAAGTALIRLFGIE
ncbi:AzlD domain-containing protein [Acinetobacter sp. V2]|uniref:AzlD domain-containing protein n=1 Tax=Acinetobacter sp. V2 TaxID=1051623 RepID=UPI00061EF5A9|nr:AzlD domain-containing protein [Acinetobacter sp. V2]KKC43834.1 branched-chain amino acid transport [Acinetobacter sp. V2]